MGWGTSLSLKRIFVLIVTALAATSGASTARRSPETDTASEMGLVTNATFPLKVYGNLTTALYAPPAYLPEVTEVIEVTPVTFSEAVAGFMDSDRGLIALRTTTETLLSAGTLTDARYQDYIRLILLAAYYDDLISFRNLLSALPNLKPAFDLSAITCCIKGSYELACLLGKENIRRYIQFLYPVLTPETRPNIDSIIYVHQAIGVLPEALATTQKDRKDTAKRLFDELGVKEIYDRAITTKEPSSLNAFTTTMHRETLFTWACELGLEEMTDFFLDHEPYFTEISEGLKARGALLARMYGHPGIAAKIAERTRFSRDSKVIAWTNLIDWISSIHIFEAFDFTIDHAFDEFVYLTKEEGMVFDEKAQLEWLINFLSLPDPTGHEAALQNYKSILNKMLKFGLNPHFAISQATRYNAPSSPAFYRKLRALGYLMETVDGIFVVENLLNVRLNEVPEPASNDVKFWIENHFDPRLYPMAYLSKTDQVAFKRYAARRALTREGKREILSTTLEFLEITNLNVPALKSLFPALRHVATDYEHIGLTEWLLKQVSKISVDRKEQGQIISAWYILAKAWNKTEVVACLDKNQPALADLSIEEQHRRAIFAVYELFYYGRETSVINFHNQFEVFLLFQEFNGQDLFINPKLTTPDGTVAATKIIAFRDPIGFSIQHYPHIIAQAMDRPGFTGFPSLPFERALMLAKQFEHTFLVKKLQAFLKDCKDVPTVAFHQLMNELHQFFLPRNQWDFDEQFSTIFFNDLSFLISAGANPNTTKPDDEIWLVKLIALADPVPKNPAHYKKYIGFFNKLIYKFEFNPFMNGADAAKKTALDEVLARANLPLLKIIMGQKKYVGAPYESAIKNIVNKVGLDQKTPLMHSIIEYNRTKSEKLLEFIKWSLENQEKLHLDFSVKDKEGHDLSWYLETYAPDFSKYTPKPSTSAATYAAAIGAAGVAAVAFLSRKKAEEAEPPQATAADGVALPLPPATVRAPVVPAPVISEKSAERERRAVEAAAAEKKREADVLAAEKAKLAAARAAAAAAAGPKKPTYVAKPALAPPLVAAAAALPAKPDHADIIKKITDDLAAIRTDAKLDDQQRFLQYTKKHVEILRLLGGRPPKAIAGLPEILTALDSDIQTSRQAYHTSVLATFTTNLTRIANNALSTLTMKISQVETLMESAKTACIDLYPAVVWETDDCYKQASSLLHKIHEEKARTTRATLGPRERAAEARKKESIETCIHLLSPILRVEVDKEGNPLKRHRVEESLEPWALHYHFLRLFELFDDHPDKELRAASALLRNHLTHCYFAVASNFSRVRALFEEHFFLENEVNFLKEVHLSRAKVTKPLMDRLGKVTEEYCNIFKMKSTRVRFDKADDRSAEALVKNFDAAFSELDKIYKFFNSHQEDPSTSKSDSLVLSSNPTIFAAAKMLVVTMDELFSYAQKREHLKTLVCAKTGLSLDSLNVLIDGIHLLRNKAAHEVDTSMTFKSHARGGAGTGVTVVVDEIEESCFQRKPAPGQAVGIIARFYEALRSKPSAMPMAAAAAAAAGGGAGGPAR